MPPNFFIFSLQTVSYNNKAISCLVERGCSPIKKVLDNATVSLKLLENHAQKSETDARSETDRARTQLTEFTDYSKRTIDQFIDDAWEPFLASNFWNSVRVDLVNSPAKRAAQRIADEASLSGILRDLFIDQRINSMIDIANFTIQNINHLPFKNVEDIPKIELLAERCKSIFLDEFEAEFQTQTIGWFQGLSTNKKYQETIFSRVTTVLELLKEKWEQLGLKENTYLKNLDQLIPAFKGDFNSDFDEYFTEDIQKEMQSIMNERYLTLFMAYVNGVGIGASIGAALVGLEIVAVGFGTIVGIVVFVVISILSTVARNKTEYISKLEKSLISNIDEEIKRQQPEILNSLEEKLSLIKNFYSVALSNSLDKMQEKLESRIKISQDNLMMAKEERQELAQKASDFIVNDIEPLTAEISQFEYSVREVWDSESA
ncbi:hypothetical protein [Crocosphaera sp.]|uniref:hypothetical protein n=1 Tax=Crocosphaera sp. TaxID=2729996 RepID=UPI0026032399|nr:hypothetical protein [Crocosphaera sp.]MDJ0583174.1 hypothetical protein [Crocosphaera sp.]